MRWLGRPGGKDAPVAAHAGSARVVAMVARAGFTTVEHGFEGSAEAVEAMETMREAGTILVSTLSMLEAEGTDMGYMVRQTHRAWKAGVKTCGW